MVAVVSVLSNHFKALSVMDFDFTYFASLSKEAQQEYMLQHKAQQEAKDTRQRVTYDDAGNIGYWIGHRSGMNWIRTFIKVPVPLNESLFKLV